MIAFLREHKDIVGIFLVIFNITTISLVYIYIFWITKPYSDEELTRIIEKEEMERKEEK
jgi:hypothetical protein